MPLGKHTLDPENRRLFQPTPCRCSDESLLVSLTPAAYNAQASIAGPVAPVQAQRFAECEMLVADGAHAILKRRVF